MRPDALVLLAHSILCSKLSINPPPFSHSPHQLLSINKVFLSSLYIFSRNKCADTYSVHKRGDELCLLPLHLFSLIQAYIW